MDQRDYGTPEDLLEADDVLTRDVFVPAINKWFRIRALSAAESERYSNSLVSWNKRGTPQINDRGTAMARLVALSVVDAQGKRMFTEEQVQKLGRQHAVIIKPIYDAAREFSALTDEEIDVLEGNSDGDQSDNGSSSSHSLSVAPSPNSSTESPVAS